MSRIRFDSTIPALWVDAAWDETILDALLRSGAPVPFYCRAGICGQCKSVLLDGIVEDVGAAPQLLTPEETRQGLVLLCRSRALTDCEVRPVQQITANEVAPWPAACIVEACERAGPALLHARFAAAGDSQPFQYRAGQYTRFENVPELAALSRVFLASRPGLSHVEAYLPSKDEVDAGVMQARLAPGTVLRLAAPTGSASLRAGENEPFVVVAERSGIGSARGMMAALASLPTPPAASFFVVGSEGGVIERAIADAAVAASATLRVVPSPDDVCAALDAALAALRAASPATKIRAYVKAGRELTKGVRSVLLRHAVRPWDSHVDPVEE